MENQVSNDQRHDSVTALQAFVLRRAVAEIKKQAERFDMRFWMVTPGGNVFSVPHAIKLREDCGTTLCLAGWIVLSTPEQAVIDIMATTERSGIGCTARTIAGLNSWQFDKLFYVSGWPHDFRSEYYAADDRGDFSEMVAALDRRVEHFIRTGA